MLIQPFLSAGKRGVQLRLIGNVTREDVPILEKLEDAVEIRHLDNIAGYFGVSEVEYLAIPDSGELNLQGPLLYSNEESFVKHHQALFEMLWTTAVPAEPRIKELKQGRVRPETRIVKGEEEVTQRVASFVSRAALAKPNPFAYGVSDKESTLRAAKGYYEYTRRLLREHPDFKILHITDIQRENIVGVKSLIEAGYEVRHIDGNKIRFSVSKGEYVETTHSKTLGGAPDEIVWSSDPQLVAQGRRIFEALWAHALPSDIRIRDIEEGVLEETMKVIRNPEETRNLYSELVGGAKKEILLLLPTTFAFHRDENIGIMDSLRIAARKGVRVSILSPTDDSIEERYPEFILRSNKNLGTRSDEGRAISLRRISQARTQNSVTILVVDGTSTLVMEERKPSSTSFTEALGFATYSTSRPTVRSSVRFFERMRDESDSREREGAALEMERNSRRQAELLQDILSHDLRNYNQAVMSSALMLKEDLEEGKTIPSDAESTVDAIIRATKGSTELIDRAKELARAISTWGVQLHTINLGATLKRAISLVTKVYDDKRIALSLSVSPEANVLADALLDEVFVNILTNAVKYTQGVNVTVSIKAQEEKENTRSPLRNPEGATPGQRYWRIDISDEGKGMPDEVKEKVFTRYATTSSGGGLGLSIVHALVKGRYGGDVVVMNRVEHDYSKGTTIQLWLPGVF